MLYSINNMIFSRLSNTLPKQRRSFSCNYEKRVFPRYGYIGAFVFGMFFVNILQGDHVALIKELQKIQKKQDHLIDLLEKKK